METPAGLIRACAAGLFLGSVLIACSAPAASTQSSSTMANASVSPAPTGRPPCPAGPERGGTCLGVLAAGTYSTTSFMPSITYTVPEGGWGNWEDREGIFVLLPPGETFAGLEADTSDWIGVFHSVGAVRPGCDEEVEPGVVSVKELTRWFARQPGLAVTKPQPISVGGLNGVMIDLSLASGWTNTCPLPFPDVPLVNLLMGTGPSEGLGVLVEASWTTRLYLLDFDGGNIAIYVMDHPGRFSLEEYDAVVRTIQFDR
jgi:hypothetical protein